MTKTEEERFQQLLAPLLLDDKVQSMKQFCQHGCISTYDHCLHVARMCYQINLSLGEKADMEHLMRVAMLHDFFLYDWHEKKIENKIHGFTHPKTAANNARRYFHVDSLEKRAIESHMWPLTIHKIPTSWEGWILCVADKYVASVETACMRKTIEA